MRSRALTWMLACAALGLRTPVVLPAQPGDAPVDAGLLEFLGSVDSDDQAWRAWLATGGAASTGYCGREPCPAASPAAPADPPPPSSAASPPRPPPVSAAAASDASRGANP